MSEGVYFHNILDKFLISILHLDDHLAGVVSSEQSHESCRHLVEALDDGLPDLDLARAHPLGHGRDPLHPPRLPPPHQEPLDLELLLYGEREDVGDLSVAALVVVVGDGPADGHPAPGVHHGEDPGGHLAADVVEVAVHAGRGGLAEALHHSDLLVVEGLVEPDLLEPGALVVTPSVPDHFATCDQRNIYMKTKIILELMK